MQLSKNFYLAEFLESQTARRHNIQEQFKPSGLVIANLKLLCENILQPLRDEVGAITISSGFRCEKVNKLIGGAVGSQHQTGEAADIKGITVSNKVLFDKIRALKLPYDQIIHEFGTKDNPAWVHVSFSKKNRRQVLYIGI